MSLNLFIKIFFLQFIIFYNLCRVHLNLFFFHLSVSQNIIIKIPPTFFNITIIHLLQSEETKVRKIVMKDKREEDSYEG